MMLRYVAPLALLLLATPGHAQSPNTVRICNGTQPNCPLIGSGNPLPVTGTSTTVPTGATTTTANSTISVTNTFQQALASSSTRKSCLLQNTGTHTQYVYFGLLGSASTGNSFQVSAGQAISCATVNGLVLTDAVNITGTSGDGYVIASQ